MSVAMLFPFRENRALPVVGAPRRTVRIPLAGRFAIAAFTLILSFASQAQTCIAPGTLSLESGGPPIFYTTCDSEPSGLSLCNDKITTTSPSHVFNVFVTQGNTQVLTLGGGAEGFNPRMYLIGGAACNSGDCSTSTDTLSLHDESPGPHLLLVTADTTDSPDSCGGFSLSLTGDPGSDEIFQDGFEQNNAD